MLDHLQAHEVSKLPYVRWVGTLPDTFKTDVFTMFESMKAEGVEADYSVILLNKSDKSSLISKVENIGGKLVNRDEGSSLVTLKLNSVQLMHTLGMKEVMWIDQSGGVEFDMDNARIQGGAEHLASLARIPSQYTGVGIIGHVMEGINPNHQDFTANGFRLSLRRLKTDLLIVMDIKHSASFLVTVPVVRLQKA